MFYRLKSVFRDRFQAVSFTSDNFLYASRNIMKNLPLRNNNRKLFYFLASFIAFLVIVYLATCQRYRFHAYPCELVAADSMCDACSDSACIYIQSLSNKIDTTDVANKWYLRLLRVKAKDKMYLKATSTSEIQPIVDYYESYGSDKHLLPYAYYYMGCAYRDLKNFPMAIEYYQKSLKHVDAENISLRSILNFQVGFLMLEQMLTKESLPYFFNSYKLEEEQGDTIMMIYVLQKIGYVYRDEKSDSCSVFYKKAAKLAEAISNKTVYNDIQSSLASYYLSKHDYKRAKICALPALKSKNPSLKTKASYLDVVASVYRNLDCLDSAAYYYNKLYELDDLEAKTVSSANLARIYRQKNDMGKAFYYFDIYEACDDSIQKIRATETVAKMNAAYNFTSYKEQNAVLEKHNMYMLFILTVALFVVFLVIILFVIWYRRNKRLTIEQNLRLLKFKKESLERSDSYIKTCELKISQLEEQLKEKNVANIDLLKLKSEYDNIASLCGIAKGKIVLRQNARSRFLSMPIYMAIDKKVTLRHPLSDEDFLALADSVNELFPDFKQSLYSVSSLSLQDYRLCLLIKAFDFSDNILSVLLSRSRSTISKAKKKLQIKFLGQESCMKEFENFIKEL